MPEYMNLKIRVFAPERREETDNGTVYYCPVEMSVKGCKQERDFPRGTLRLEPVALRTKQFSSEYSQLLDKAIFTDRPNDIAFQQALAVASTGQCAGLRVCLQLDEAAKELHDEIQWERLGYVWESNHSLVGIKVNTPFYRGVPNYHWDHLQPIQKKPIRILVIMASPERRDLPRIPHAEFLALRRLFDSLKGCVVTYLETGTDEADKAPSFENLQQELSYNQYHIVHFMCHGKKNENNNETILYLENPVKGSQFVEWMSQLEPNKKPIFCFLTACESGKGLEPLGLQLVRDGGVGAALAMTDPVSIATSNIFVPHFYHSLFAQDGGVLDIAINKARRFIQDRTDWGVSVLFSRLPNNQLIIDERIEVDEVKKCPDGTFFDGVCWSRAEVYFLILNAFTTSGLTLLINNQFPKAVNAISSSSHEGRVDELLSICKIYGQMDHLLEVAKEMNSFQYAKHFGLKTRKHK